MMKRKELKKNARRSLKKHWLTLVFVCIIGMLITGEALFARYNVKTTGSSSFLASREQNAESDEEVIEKWQDILDRIEISTDDSSNTESITVTDLDSLLESSVNSHETTTEDYRRGVLSGVMSRFSSGSFFPTMAASIVSLLRLTSSASAVSLLISTLLAFIFWFLFKNIYAVISARMFLESHQYEKVHMHRLTYIFRSGHWFKACATMFLKEVFQTLWSLTIIGGIIKYYSYFLVPYIVAENPDIAPLDAITLSRKMMKGHKWQCFILQMSFLGWEILNLFTFNILNLAFLRPYENAAECEFYIMLRNEAKEAQLEGIAALNDIYLYTFAPEDLLAGAYEDAARAYQGPSSEEDVVQLKGAEYVLANYFGIAVRETEAVRKFEQNQIDQQTQYYRREAYEKKAYPSALNKPKQTGTQTRKHARGVHLNAFRIYSVWSIILIYFFMSFVGWIWEVSLHIITDGTFVNRGVLQGPWLPIYGTGSVLVLILLYRLRKDPIKELLATIVVCGIVEYFTAYYLELTHDGTKWWDYTGYFLNLHGRICAEGLITFGIGGMFIVYLIAPILDAILRKVGTKRLIVVSLILLALYAVDNGCSAKHPNTGEGITDYTSQVLFETDSAPAYTGEITVPQKDGTDSATYIIDVSSQPKRFAILIEN